METRFTLQELDRIVYNKLLFFLDRQKYKIEPNKIRDHTVEYLIYSGEKLIGVFKITQRADGIVEYIGNGAGNQDPELSNAWFNLYYKMLIPIIEQEEKKRSKLVGKESTTNANKEWLRLQNVDFEIVDAQIMNVLERLDVEQGLSIHRSMVTPALIRYACPHEFEGIQLQKYPEWVEITQTGTLPSERPPEMSQVTWEYYLKHQRAVATVFAELRKFKTRETAVVGKKRRERILSSHFAKVKDEVEKYLWQGQLKLKLNFESFKIDLPEGQAYQIYHTDYGELGQLSIYPRESETRLRVTKPVNPSQDEATESYLKAGYPLPRNAFEAVDWLFQQRENTNEEFWNDLLRYLRNSKIEVIDPRELYGVSYHSLHSIELLEKTLAGLPMKAFSEIDFCTFEKLSDQPYGYVRYNVLDSVDTYIGCVTLERRGNEATTIGLQYQMKFDVTFKKIKAIWDKYIAYDLELATIGKEKQRASGETVKVISERTAALNKLAILWVRYNQKGRISKHDDMEWFINENAQAVGLSYVSVNEFKKHLPKAHKAGIIDKDPKSGRFIPKLPT
jgi:hypothetical protein